MQIYVVITDYNWFQFLMSVSLMREFLEVRESTFKAFQENDLFLFKLHASQNYNVGSGYFVKHSLLPTYLVWAVFEEKNGTSSYQDLNSAIDKYLPATTSSCGISRSAALSLY